MNRSLFRYFGGKAQLAPWIVSHFPGHEYYIEPFCGAASVFFKKRPAKYELLNDLNGDVVNVFRILQNEDKTAKLVRKLYLTPYSREIYNNSFDVVENVNDIDRAVRFLIIASMSFNAAAVNGQKSGFRNYFKTINHKRYSIPANDWSTWANHLDFFCARLQGVLIENLDAFKIIKKYQAHDDVLLYVDPPYIHNTRKKLSCKYSTELSDDDHHKLVEAIREFRGSVVLSGYDSAIYKRLEANGWRKESKRVQNNYMKNTPTECVWLNYKAR